MYYSRKTHKLYQKRKSHTVGCPFCDPAEIQYRLLFETEYFYVIPNQTPYEVWENHAVVDHLMIIPKRHIESLGECSDEELIDFGHLCCRYESLDYSVYARARQNKRRSVAHQHTHLLKIDNKSPRASLYIAKPYYKVTF